MEKNKHMDLNARFEIEYGLNKRLSFKAIALRIGKDCTTVSKEVRSHLIFKKVGGAYRTFNDCRKRFKCFHQGDLCEKCHMANNRKCIYCKKTCCSFCPDYEKESCDLLLKPPYVCNGCTERNKCTLEKHLYNAPLAQREYMEVRSESRTGFNLTEQEIHEMDDVISPLLKAGQSIHHIMVNNPDQINCCEKSAYTYLDSGLFTARNIDAPRIVRLRPRRAKSVPVKVDKACRIGRDIQAFHKYMQEHPGLTVVELDSVEGVKGSAVLLTVHFIRQNFQLAFRREHNDSASVTAIFNDLYKLLDKEAYMKLFPVLLADNGTEFSNPRALEFNKDGEQISHVFYCDPSAPSQKGSCEVNHEFIRRIIPKGVDIAHYSQEQILLMMSHINSYGRPELGDKSPYEMFDFYFGSGMADKFGMKKIPPNDIILKPRLLKI